ncbi:MAG: S41 family peptidase [Candidatus Neomarinimicrobiota bacterium]
MKAFGSIPMLLAMMLSFACSDLLVEEATSDQHLADFDMTWDIVNTRYVYLDWKQIDWDSLRTVYRPRTAAAQGDEFYQVLHDLLAELKDGHVYYQTEGGGQVYPYFPTPRMLRDRHAYSPYVVRTYFDRELRVTEGGGFEYEILPGNIGYLWISSYQSEGFETHFATALAYLRNTDGLIIDDRGGSGGNRPIVWHAVGRFITTSIDSLFFYDAAGNEYQWPAIDPVGSFQYTKPVVVIINGSSYSASEHFADLMKLRPNTTVIGDTTGGGSGGSEETGYFAARHTLPSGKKVNIPTIDVRRWDGLPWETIGVPPQIRVPQTAEDIKRGQDKQLEYAIDLLQ